MLPLVWEMFRRPGTRHVEPSGYAAMLSDRRITFLNSRTVINTSWIYCPFVVMIRLISVKLGSPGSVAADKATTDKEQRDSLNLPPKQVTEYWALRSVNSCFRPTQKLRCLQSSFLRGELRCSLSPVRLTCSRKQLRLWTALRNLPKGFWKGYYSSCPKNIESRNFTRL
jgi:hypothetical protein